MSDKPLPWPYDVANHRDRAAEECEAARRKLMGVLSDGQVTHEEFADLGLVLGHIDQSEMHLIHVGAKIEPQ